MEKHKYTPVRLTPEELFILTCFQNQNFNFISEYGNDPAIIQPALRQLYRLDFLGKAARITGGDYYRITEKGLAHLNRPRIKIFYRTQPDGICIITYQQKVF